MGFYFGFLTYAISDAIGGAFKFSVWEAWKQRQAKSDNIVKFFNVVLQQQPSENDDTSESDSRSNNRSVSEVMVKLSGWMYIWLGAAVACVASSVLIVPGELLKQQLQN